MPAFFRAHGKKQYIQAHFVDNTTAQTRTDEEVRELLRLLPRYRVVLHNDDVHAMDEVVMALLRTVPTLSIEAATAIMFEAHNTGRAQVIICPREPAEHYRERLEHFTLTCTIEPV